MPVLTQIPSGPPLETYRDPVVDCCATCVFMTWPMTSNVRLCMLERRKYRLPSLILDGLVKHRCSRHSFADESPNAADQWNKLVGQGATYHDGTPAEAYPALTPQAQTQPPEPPPKPLVAPGRVPVLTDQIVREKRQERRWREFENWDGT